MKTPRYRRLLCATVLAALTGLPASKAAAEDWVELFDGKTLNGWVQKNGMATYRIENGSIVGRTTDKSRNSFLCTAKEYGNFELEFSVKVHDSLNSGVQIRSRTKTEASGSGANDAVGRVYGPQVEIEASGDAGALAGYVYGEATGRGWLTAEERLKPRKVFRNGDWNHFRIVAQGPRIQTWINGTPIEDLTDEPIFETHPTGFIGLQVHGISEGAGPYEVAWKDIRIKER